MSTKKKQFLAGLVCSLMIAMALQPDTMYAASLSASADTGSAAKGEYVNVSVNLSSNPSISTLGAALNYDSSVLKYDSSTWNGGFSGNDMQMATDTGKEINLSVVCDDSYQADGTVVTVRFQAVKDTSSIPVTLSLREMADADLAAVSDCQVASAVQAPQAAEGPEDNDIVDLEDPTEDSGVVIVDEESDPADLENAGGSGTGSGNTTGQTDSNTASGTLNGSGSVGSTAGGAASGADIDAGSGADESVQVSQGASDTQQRMAAADASETTRLDFNYKTGAGIGSDVYLVAAAVFGILALVLLIKRHREN